MFASSTPMTPCFEQFEKPSKRFDVDSPENVVFSMSYDGAYKLERFDSKNPEEDKSGEYIPVLSYVRARSRNN